MIRAAVTYYPGDGTEYALDVAYISDFPRGVDGTCAFCKGDPCAERPESPYRIRHYFELNKTWAQVCPMCDGRPT